jgi:signal transduction histidine kinase
MFKKNTNATFPLKAKNNQLEESMEIFKMLLDTTPKMILSVDDKGKIIDINQLGVDMMGYEDKKELIDNNIMRYIIPSQIAKLKDSFLDNLESIELTFVKKDDTLINTLLYSQQIIMHSNSIRMITVLDLSKFLEHKKRLQQQSRLAQMGEMISMIAHQWRQPLGAISANCIDMKMKLQLGNFDLKDEKNKQACKEFIIEKNDNIGKYIQTLTSTIDDFRNFFKPDKDVKVVKITDPIQKALQITEIFYPSKGINIEVDYQTEDNVSIYPNEMMQVILNFFKNSEDNFKEKRISNALIKISTRKEKNKYTINIEDNGGGIKGDVLPHIFEPYFSTKDEKNGTGLGLYMSKIIVEDHHNGKLKVFNTNKGVCFSIELKKSKEL